MSRKKKKRLVKKIIFAASAFVVILTASLICINVLKNGNSSSGYNNEEDALVFSTLEVDKVFNPFFSTSATDSSVVSLTQISMLSNDKDGQPVYGDKEAVVTKDLEIVTTGVEDVDQTTTYYFVLKNNVRFSNGSYLTIKDVLFNYYVYLDPVYSGSSTIYSTDIVGLKEYRTQSSDEFEQDGFKTQFANEATNRISSLINAKRSIYKKYDTIRNADEFLRYLTEYQQENSNNAAYQNIVKDYNKAVEFFKEELELDYSNSLNSYQDIVFTDDKDNLYKDLLTTDVEAFLYNEGYITWNKKDAKLECSFGTLDMVKKWTKEEAIEKVFQLNIPSKLEQVVYGWVYTSGTLKDYLTNEEMENYFSQNSARQYKNISGIQFANKDEPVVVNGKEYGVPTYDENGVINSRCNEVLSITINNIDPKAIWNFSIGVAPMYYYSNQEQIDLFDFDSHFGVEYASQTFMNEVVKNPDKIGVPVGAGPYAASKASGGLTDITAADFYNLGVIYYERNPYYVMGPASIKKVRYQVVSTAQMLNSLYNGEVDFIEPNAKPETIAELNAKKDEGIGNKEITTLGYGYIGINAGKVPSYQVRQAIMHSINTQECVDYYKTTADPIYRPMSIASWAYPEGCTPYYPYIAGPVPEDLTVVNPYYADFVKEKKKETGDKFTEEEQKEFLTRLVESAGYTLNDDNVYTDGTNVLKYTFTIAGQETDHPAFRAMNHAAEILNQVGFNIIVKTDANALSKLSTGALTVWAAAWGSTIDPDMYQVYHMDSQATSTLNWGYKQILQNPSKYAYEYEKIVLLSDLIEAARKTNDQDDRTILYSEALDIVMELAIELPTYQRNDLFAFNANKIDTDTFNSDTSPFKGLTSDIHNVSLNVEK